MNVNSLVVRLSFSVCLTVSISGANIGCGQSNELFEATVSRFKESREAITSYCLRIHGTEISETSFGIKGKQKGEIKTSRSMRNYDIEMACDRANDRFIAIFRPAPFLPGINSLLIDPDVLDGDGAEVYLIDKQTVKHFSNGAFVNGPSLSAVRIPDPLTIGAAFCAEARNHYPLEKVLEGMESWNSRNAPWIVASEGSLVRFRKPSRAPPPFAAHQGRDLFSIAFDTQRGYSPVAIEMSYPKAGGELFNAVDGRVEHRRFAGHWLPYYSCFKCESIFQTYSFDWFSINDPLPADLFDPEILSILLGGSRT